MEKGLFSKKGKSILSKKPKSMSELMTDREPLRPPKKPGSEVLGRLHCQIRQDLVTKIDEAIFESKKDPQTRNLTKRTIVEEALKEYFKKRS